MKCVLPALNIKIFARAIHSLARIGEDLQLKPGANGLSLSTVNSSRSAFASFTFSPRFFSQYEDCIATKADGMNSDVSLNCKVNMKACVNIFKSLTNVERTIEKCKLTLDLEECKFVIQLTCRYNIIKTHNLPFLECETLQAIFDSSDSSYHITSQSKLLSDSFLNFLSGQEEVCFDVSPAKTIIRNYTDDASDSAKSIHTELSLDSNEFDTYKVGGSCNITFSLKELRALLTFTEPVNLPITALFSSPGDPILFTVNNLPMFEVSFVLATLALPEVLSQQSHSKKVNTTNSNTTLNKNRSDMDTLRANDVTRESEKIIEQPSECFRNANSVSVNTTKFSHMSNGNVGNSNTKSHLKSRPSNLNQLESTIAASPDLPNLTRPETPDEGDEEMPGTPPSKKAKFFFKRCFDLTFNPESVPGQNIILAEDSDEGT